MGLSCVEKKTSIFEFMFNPKFINHMKQLICLLSFLLVVVMAKAIEYPDFKTEVVDVTIVDVYEDVTIEEVVIEVPTQPPLSSCSIDAAITFTYSTIVVTAYEVRYPPDERQSWLDSNRQFTEHQHLPDLSYTYGVDPIKQC